MYNLYRKIHLYSGLILLMYVMMFFVSGYIMTHRPWFLGAPGPTTTRTAVLEPGLLRLSNEQLAANLQKQLRLAGGIQFPLGQPPNLIRFFVIRPGTTVRVDVSTQDKLIRVITQRYGWVDGGCTVANKARVLAAPHRTPEEAIGLARRIALRPSYLAHCVQLVLPGVSGIGPAPKPAVAGIAA